MAVAVVLLLVIGLVVMSAAYARDVRVRPGAGGSLLRFSLRWAMVVVAAACSPPWCSARPRRVG